MPAKVKPVQRKKQTASERSDQTLVCLKCDAVKPISDFYTNRDWKERNEHDAWCKTCMGKCITKDAMKQYFWENNRKWSESYWNSCVRRAEESLADSQTFAAMNDIMRNATVARIACSLVPKSMSSGIVYEFEDHGLQLSKGKSAPEDLTIDEQTPQYSQEFNGYFRKSELDYLKAYYAGLDSDFDLSDTNIRDIAKKLAKASLQADKAQDDYMHQRVDYSVVKDAISQFDLLSKSGNFAACKRKKEEASDLGSWAEITLRLEQTGHPCTRKIEWEQDDVDRVLSEYSHIVQALSLDQV